MKNIKMKNL
ncbi:hypothetical protein MTR67_023409 [Solanum verrucosum]|uniref:Uncharacterized protein n=1 Tax=Solanum verrucosum TaxID=315347 RepID=A0AAF0TS54_SOLVR|nr:hypothetical protein MTR67_023409 [Solanum verrucosum]